jgi:DNA-3-methyladenine glycosylase II
MLLMFALGREDIFSVDDYGIQSGMVKLYKLQSWRKNNCAKD